MNIEQAWALRVGHCIYEGPGESIYQVTEVRKDGVNTICIDRSSPGENYSKYSEKPRFFRFDSIDFIGWVKVDSRTVANRLHYSQQCLDD